MRLTASTKAAKPVIKAADLILSAQKKLEKAKEASSENRFDGHLGYGMNPYSQKTNLR
jgi:precorrin-6B methylase 1